MMERFRIISLLMFSLNVYGSSFTFFDEENDGVDLSSNLNQKKVPRFKLDDISNFIGGEIDTQGTNSAFHETQYVKQHVTPHVRRYVKMFLRYSTLADYDLSKNSQNSIIYATLHVGIRADYLEKLQNFYKDENVEISLVDFDRYLSNILYHTTLGKVDTLLTWTSHKLTYILPDFRELIKNANLNHIQMTQWAYVGIFLLIFYLFFRLRYSAICTGMVTLCLLMCVETVQLYHNRLKAKEMEQYLKMKENLEYKSRCDPNLRGFFSTITNFFYSDSCLEMMLAENMHFSTEVSLVNCFLDTILTVIEKLGEYFGKTVGAMASNIVGPSWTGMLMYPIMVAILLFFMSCMLLIFVGSHIKFSVWPFSSLEFGRKSAPSIPPRPINAENSVAPVNISIVYNGRTARKYISRAAGLPIGFKTSKKIKAAPVTEDQIDSKILNENNKIEDIDITPQLSINSSNVETEKLPNVDNNGENLARSPLQSTFRAIKNIVDITKYKVGAFVECKNKVHREEQLNTKTNEQLLLEPEETMKASMTEGEVDCKILNGDKERDDVDMNQQLSINNNMKGEECSDVDNCVSSACSPLQSKSHAIKNIDDYVPVTENKVGAFVECKNEVRLEEELNAKINEQLLLEPEETMKASMTEEEADCKILNEDKGRDDVDMTQQWLVNKMKGEECSNVDSCVSSACSPLQSRSEDLASIDINNKNKDDITHVNEDKDSGLIDSENALRRDKEQTSEQNELSRQTNAINIGTGDCHIACVDTRRNDSGEGDFFTEVESIRIGLKSMCDSDLDLDNSPR